MSAPPAPGVFLSYAREDVTAGRSIADALRGDGVDVWFDADELRGGEAWDREIRQRIKNCALFLAIISHQTDQRREGYFRLEWRLAEERTQLMARGTAFLVPICIDDTREATALVPDIFLQVQWTRLHGGEATPAFRQRIKQLLAGRHDTSAPSPETAPRIPDYELLRQIGRGSYGDVWLARSLTGLYRAIKIVWRDRFTEPAPFEREFRGLTEFAAAASTAGGGQLALLHVGRNDAVGFFYYVMELADDATSGGAIDPARYVPLTLAELRRQRARLPAAECTAFAIALARELGELHARGLVHRDIKPSNVIVVGGVPKLADIGLVSRVSDARTFVGTEGFVPPEGPGSAAADVYALGKLVYELSTGIDRTDFPQLPDNLSRLTDHAALLRLNEIVLRACDPRPERRYADGRAMLADLQRLKSGQPARRSRRRWLLTTAAVLVLVAATAMGLGRRIHFTQSASVGPPVPKLERDPTTIAREKSILVLPFENIGDPANAHVADGMHAELIAALSGIGDFKVIARQSTMVYKDNRLPLPELGQKLGVGNIITGSVQVAAGRVRVHLELQRATDQHVLWPATFDRPEADRIAVQVEIADRVARLLQARQAPTNAQFSSKNVRAYELYTKSLNALLFSLGSTRRDELEKAVPLLEEALREDPEFAAAANRLSTFHTLLARNYVPEMPAKLAHAEQARQWAETASRLVPGGGGNLSLAYYTLMIRNEPGRALSLLHRCLEVWPNDSSAHEYVASALSSLGRTVEALQWTRQSIALDPHNPLERLNLLLRLAWLRRRAEWQNALHEYRAMAPHDGMTHWAVPQSRYVLTGELAATKQELAAIPQFAVQRLYLGRYFADAVETADAQMAQQPDDHSLFELYYHRSAALRQLGRTREAAEAANAAVLLAEQLKHRPEIDDEKHHRTARALALVGRFDEAIAAGLQHAGLPSLPDQVMVRWRRAIALAQIYAQANRPKDCVAVLAPLLRVPSRLTVPMLRTDPVWDPVRSDPRFQALLNDPENNKPL